MNLDELQSVQARERQSSDLQHLRASFYREVGEYVHDLSEERDRLVEQAEDPFSAPEVRQLTDDIETAEQTVEAIYERRVGKVVKKASIAAAGMPVDADGLTEEEETLFEDLVTRIESNRETVLSVLDGEPPDLTGAGGSAGEGPAEGPGGGTPDTAGGDAEPTPEREPDPEPDAGGVSAADLMGGDADADPADGGEPTADAGGDDAAAANDPAADPLAADPDDGPTEVPPEDGPPGESDAGDEDASGDPASEDGSADGGAATGDVDPGEDHSDPPSADRDVPGIPRTTVRITADVGEVVGADDRDYDLGPEDVVTLPEPNADVLVENDAAERLE